MLETINRRALLIAAGVGIAVALCIGVTSNGLIYVVDPDIVRDPQNALGSPVYLMVLALGCSMYLIYAGLGVLYAWLAQRNGTILTAGSAAVGGLLTVLIVQAFQFLMGLVVSLTVGQQAMEASMRQYQQLGVDLGNNVFVVTIVTLCFSMCLTMLIGGALSAAGAAIYAAITGSRQSNAPPAAV